MFDLLLWFDSCLTQKALKMFLFGFWILFSPPSCTGNSANLGFSLQGAFTSSPQTYQHLNHNARHQSGNAELGVSWSWGQNRLRLSSHFCLQAFLKGAMPIEKGAQSETLPAMNSAHVFLLEPVKIAPRLKHPNSLSGSSTLACIWAHFCGMKEDES